MLKHNLEYLTSIGITLSFSILYGILEYYWIITDRDVPFRYGHEPVFLGFQLYHIAVMLPIFTLVGLSPFLDDWIGTSARIEKWYTTTLGFATTIFAVMLEDIVWFTSRVLRPLPLDQLGGKWIQSSDWTARWSYVDIGGGVIPTWYFIVAILTFTAWFIVFRHWTSQRLKSFAAEVVVKLQRPHVTPRSPRAEEYRR